MSHERLLSEDTQNKASKGFFYVHGGFSIWGDHPVSEDRAKRKLTAILSADVKGYSRLMGEDEEAAVRTLKAYRKLITTLVQKQHGSLVDSPGDNILVDFTSMVEAVRCAVEIQEELNARNAELPENRRMKFRIGINLTMRYFISIVNRRAHT